MSRVLIMFTFIFLVAGCGKKNSSGRSPLPSVNPVRPGASELRPLEITQRETVNFHRIEQKVYRYNCAGQIISQKMETQNALSKRIAVNYANRKKTWSFSVTNRRNNRGATLENINSDGHFTVDYAPTLLHVRVKQGINDIEYVFTQCTQMGRTPDGNKSCLGQVIMEKEGIVQVDVNYSSSVLPNDQHIHPNPSTCRR